jgi:hypothetical protein
MTVLPVAFLFCLFQCGENTKFFFFLRQCVRLRTVKVMVCIEFKLHHDLNLLNEIECLCCIFIYI